MAFLAWSDQHEIGIPVLDAQHQDLCSTVNKVHECFAGQAHPEKVALILDFLFDYARTHFHEEERLMEAHGDPNLLDHRLAHQSLLARLGELREQGLARPAAHHGEAIVRCLAEWMSDHVPTLDAALGRHLRAVGAPQARLSRIQDLIQA